MEDIKCTSVEFEDGGITKTYTSCWSYTVPDVGWSAEEVEGALPRSLAPGARSWRTCKYFVKGMPAVCSHFDGVNQRCNQPKNTEGTEDGKRLPSGYNFGNCDFLGRQTFCDKYQPSSEDDLDQYICILPNMFLSGVGRKVEGAEYPEIKSIKINEISGYNDDGNGVGRCDCYGMGRGAAGCAEVGSFNSPHGSSDIEKKLSKLPVVCNFYRPFAMGFGAIQPHEARRADGSVDVDRLSEMESSGEPLSYRNPFSFDVFNLRARFQPCLWYESNLPGVFQIDNQGIMRLDDDLAFDSQNRLINCKCSDPRCFPFKTRVASDSPVLSGVKTIMANVWAEAGTVVCNGAKPECPLYTGKWYYCIDEKMWDGMPITAQQIMELRFWSYDWDSQEEYDKYYSDRPNPDDTNRPEIYTFTRWARLIENTEFSQMEGKKVSMCQPAPLQLKEFIPEKYLSVSKITYDTFGTNAPNQVTFPNLIRDPRFPNLKPLTVIYPYASEEVFDEEVCNPNKDKTIYSKLTNEVYSDYIHTIGQTLRNTPVYVINLTAVGSVPRVVSENANSLTMTPDIKAALAADLSNYISRAFEFHNQYIKTTYSDSISGVFILDPIQLKFGYNLLLIVVDFGGGEFNFKKREVNSLWCGGVIVQTLYDYNVAEGITYDLGQPGIISPPAEIEANIVKLGASAAVEVLPARSVYIPSWSYGDTIRYSYCVYWEEINDEVQSKVCPVGNSPYIWCEIDNIDLNHIFEFEVVSAEAEIILKANEDGSPKESIVVELEKVELDDRYIPPNACLLRPKDLSRFRFRLFPTQCKVTLSYRYQKFAYGPVPEGKVGVFGAGTGISNVFKPVGFAYVMSDNILKVSGVRSDTVGFMCFFKDEKGRIVSAVATRLMPYIIRPSCRSVEIRYRYQADGKQYALTPETGWCVNIGRDRLTGEVIPHISDPMCGDHLVSVAGGGPMWFPYNSCELYEFYDVWAIANFCTAPLDVGPINKGLICKNCGPAGAAKRNDHRYRGPDMYMAKAEPAGYAIAACGCGYRFTFSDASNVTPKFTGYANIKGKINEAEYNLYGWRHPPFGNDAREFIERYLSQDYVYYYSLNNPLLIKSEWAPFVIDNSTFFWQFDAFSSIDNTYDLDFSGAMGNYEHNNFKYTNQLNYLLFNSVNENIDYENRKRFDEIFKVRVVGNCVYPPPVLDTGNTTAVAFYQFQDDRTLWAWQELWKEIERNVGAGTELFSFISEYERPPYIWSLFKEEIRLICDEGDHEIIFTGPKIAQDSDIPGDIEVYPSVSLDGAHPKHFEILYGSPDENGVWHYNESDYGDQSVEWKVEGAQGQAGGSSERDNVYEDRLGSEWVFSLDERFKNMLFDESSPQEFYYRRELDGSYTKKKYCTGLMVRIPRSRLMFLPKDKKEEKIRVSNDTAQSENFVFDCTAVIDDAPGGLPGNNWKGNAVFSCENAFGKVLSKLVIRGKYGRVFSERGVSEIVYVKPGLTINGVTVDGEMNYSPRGISSSAMNSTLPPPKQAQVTTFYDYEIIYNFPLSPIEMLKKGYMSFTFSLLSGHASYYINVSEIFIETAQYKETAKEKIKVWERKYIPSSGDVQWKNLDGPHELLSYKNGCGVHFRYDLYLDEKIQTQNKMRGFFAESRKGSIWDDEPISVDYQTLFSVEAHAQRSLYEKAIALDPYKERISYNTICPPPLSKFFNDTLKNILFVGVGSSLFLLQGISWDKLGIVKEFLQTEYWRTGGHYFKWSDYFTYQSCRIGAHNTMFMALVGMSAGRYMYATNYENVFEGRFIHVGHVGEGNPLTSDPSQPVSVLDSYYSLRFYYTQARYEKYYQLTGQTPDGGEDLVQKGNIYLGGL